jgi:hypothetical protein
VSKVLCPFRNTRRHKNELLENCASFAIGVFEDDDESLHFPEEETLEVDEVQLRSGHQLSDPYPHSKPSKCKDVTPNEKSDHVSNVSVKYDVIAHLKKIPAMLLVYDALGLSSNLHKAFITVLSFPEDYRFEVSQAEIKPNRSDDMIFNDGDLLLGDKKHIMPLFMFGDIDDLPINRIMVDGGSAINLLPLRTLKKIGYSQRDLSHSNVVIHGFNQAGQEAMGTISLVLKLEKFMTYVKFHVIDVATSYNDLLGRLWLHENKIVPSTLHQCLKYKDPLGEVVTIFADKRHLQWLNHSMRMQNSISSLLTKYQSQKSRCLLNQRSQRKIVEKLHPSKRYINMSQAIKGKEVNQYFASYTNHPKMKVLISRHPYHLWYNEK